MRLESITVSLGYLSLPCIVFFENNCYCYRTTNKQADGRTCTPSRFSSGSQYWPNIKLAGVAVSNIGSTAAVQYATTMLHRGNKSAQICPNSAKGTPNVCCTTLLIYCRRCPQYSSDICCKPRANIIGRKRQIFADV